MLDVLHLSFHHHTRNSISKIVSNLLKCCPVEQYHINLPMEIDDLALLINKSKPKILHFHFNSLLNIEKLLDELDYKPVCIQTLHADIASKCPDLMDKIICIHKPCYDKNDPAKSVIIENTVDVDVHLEVGKKDVCSSFRFVPIRVNKPIIKAYESIQGSVHLFGELPNNPYMKQVYGFLKPDTNITICPYSNSMEKTLSDYKIYVFYLDEETNHSNYCYGLCVMEASASGIPVVAIQRSQNYQKYIKNGYNGFIVSDAVEFKQACDRLLNDSEFYSVVKANAIDNAKSLDNCMPKLYGKLYSEFLER